MSENDTKKDLLNDETDGKAEKIGKNDDWVKEFAMDELELAPLSSAEFLKKSEDILSLNEPETPLTENVIALVAVVTVLPAAS